MPDPLSEERLNECQLLTNSMTREFAKAVEARVEMTDGGRVFAKLLTIANDLLVEVARLRAELAETKQRVAGLVEQKAKDYLKGEIVSKPGATIEVRTVPMPPAIRQAISESLGGPKSDPQEPAPPGE